MEHSFDLLANRTLLQLTLPGTHDSGSYYLSNKLLPNYTTPFFEDIIKLAEDLGIPAQDIITPWSISQACDFYQQLSGGIRYLDVRAGYCPGSECSSMGGAGWYVFHFEIGNTIDSLMQQVAQFLQENPSEVIIVEISHTNYDESYQIYDEQLIQVVQNHLGPYLYPRSFGYNSTIKEMVSTGKRALVSIDVADQNLLQLTDFWFGNTIYNTYANSDNLTQMTQYNTGQVEYYNHGFDRSQLFKLSWTLTPQTSTVEKSILPDRPRSLYELSSPAIGSPLVDFVEAKKQQQLPLGNIVIIDFFDLSQIVQMTNDAVWPN